MNAKHRFTANDKGTDIEGGSFRRRHPVTIEVNQFLKHLHAECFVYRDVYKRQA